MTTARDPSLDAFRGLTVLLMAVVNLQGSGEHAFRLLEHAPWNGLTLADLVFPWFLLIVGLSVPLALDGRTTPVGRIVRRAALLFALGVVLAWLIKPSLDIAQVRWMGVLQRIGIVYLACALAARADRGWRGPALLAAVCLIVHAILLHSAPPDGPASLAQGQGMASWLDRTLLPGRFYRPGWDPEGALSTLGAIASGLIGVAVTRSLRARTDSTPLLAGGALFTIAGLASALTIPVNKALWTPSFVLLTAGLGLLVWSLLRFVWRGIGSTGIARFTVFAGRTALTFYVVHMLLMALLVRRLPGGERIWDAGYAGLATGLPPPVASLAFALIIAAISLALTALLARRGWVLKL